MKRKLNESTAFDLQSLADDYGFDFGDIENQIYDLEDGLHDDRVTGDINCSFVGDDDTTIVINDQDSLDTFYNLMLNDFDVNPKDVDSYMVSADDLLDESEDFDEADNSEFDDYETVSDDYTDEDDAEFPPYDEDDELNSDYQGYSEYRDVQEDDEFESDDYDDEEVLDECGDCDDDDEFCEDEEFECYESVKNRHNKRINERKKGCCPPKRGMVNLSESLKAKSTKLSIRDIVESAKTIKLDESIISKAINKAYSESRKEKRNNRINENRSRLNKLKEAVGSDKFELVKAALKEGRKTLYTKKTINGKNIANYKSKELLEMLTKAKEQVITLKNSKKNLNESKCSDINETLEKKLRLINLLDEELTYRLTVKQLSKNLNEDDENPLEPLPVGPDSDGEKEDEEVPAEESDKENDSEEEVTPDEDESTPDEDEEVELSRVVITVANQDAADELKSALVDAGIPDDAIEFEEEEDDTEDDTESEESDEETSEESDEETPNESIHYSKFKRLLEDDSDDEDKADDAEANDSDNATESDDEESDDESNDDKDGDSQVKVVLTNTDYINDLADVLNNEYGITKDEFEDMIGGEIVDDENSDEEADDESDDESDDKEDNKDEKQSKGDAAVDAMTQDELDDLFGNA